MKRTGLYITIAACWLAIIATGFVAQYVLAFGPEWLSIDNGPAVPIAIAAVESPLFGAAFWCACRIYDMGQKR